MTEETVKLARSALRRLYDEESVGYFFVGQRRNEDVGTEKQGQVRVILDVSSWDIPEAEAEALGEFIFGEET